MPTTNKAPRARKPAAAPVADAPATVADAPAAAPARDRAAEREARNMQRKAHTLAAFAAFRELDTAGAVKSFPLKALAKFAREYNRNAGPTTACATLTVRAAAYLATLAVASRVTLADGAVIPRRVTITGDNGEAIPCVGENGAASDVQSCGAATYSPEAESFTLRPGTAKRIAELLGEAKLREHGVY